MMFSGMLLGALIAAVQVLGLSVQLRKKGESIPLLIWYLLCILPFLAGGFHTYISAVTAGILLFSLIRLLFTRDSLAITRNLSTLACLVLVLAYSVTPIWAADKGMAVLGILRYLPVLLLALVLMQEPAERKTRYLDLLPLCGAIMTITGCILWGIPAARNLVSINGRLSGFFQYPNTFAAFLLTGVAVLGSRKARQKGDIPLALILLAGILLSGSRTGVLLLVFLLLGLAASHRKIPPVILPAAVAAGSAAMGFLLLSNSRATLLGRDMSSLIIRIMYYKDALPVILRHPFGLGYLGYRALETTFQTSRYTVSFVHCSLLQLLLDIGWVPSVLFLMAAGKTLLSKNTPPTAKAVLSVLLAHSLVDFDMQCFLFWAVLLLCMDFERGKRLHLKIRKPLGLAAAVSVFALCAWLGLGDFLYQTGQTDAVLKVMPFHTDALSSAMKETADPDELDTLADRILHLNPTHALAYSAKANAAYARGRIAEMMRYKEEAIRLTPYTAEEYCDYIQKLYTLLEYYVQSGDTESASFCLDRMLSIPDQIARVSAKTDPLTALVGKNTTLVLPKAYRQLLEALAAENGIT